MIPTIPGYVVQRELGQGGMGVVYLATRQATGEPVAVKILRTTGSPERQLRFEREVQALRQVQHPNIVRLLDYGRSPDGVPFLVMEYLPGVATLDVVPRPTPLWPWLIQRMVELFEALDHLHSRPHPLIHRDVKPQNLGVGEDGRLVLLDFGVVSIQGEATLTQADTPVGTLAYAAPEQLNAPKFVDPRCDLYAAGMVMLDLILGTNPLEDLPVTDIFSLLLIKRLSPLAALRQDLLRVTLPELPPGLEAVLERLLANHPSERFGCAREVREALQRLQGNAGQGSTLVGRQAVVLRLQQLLEHAGDGAGQAVVVWGPRGSGKSRILTELASMVGDAPVDIYRIRTVSELADRLGCPSDVPALVAELGRRSRSHGLLVCLDPDPQEDVSEFLRQAGRGARGKRYLLACTADAPVPAPNVLGLELGDLSPEAARDMVRQRIGADLSDKIDMLVTLSGGNPASLATICSMANTARSKRPADPLETVLRESMAEDVAGHPAAELLGAAGLLGDAFELELLSHVTGRPVTPDDLGDALVEVERGRWRFRTPLQGVAAASLLQPEASNAVQLSAVTWLESCTAIDRASRVIALLVSTLKRTPDPEVRRRLGTVVLREVRQRVTDGHLQAVYDLMAQIDGLFDMLETPVEATLLTAYAALAALIIGKPGEATMLCTRADEVRPTLAPAVRAEVAVWVGRVYMGLSQFDKAVPRLREAQALLTPDDGELWFRVHHILGQVCDNGSELVSIEEALQGVDICLEAAREGQIADRVVSLALELQLQLLRRTGRYTEAERSVEHATRLKLGPMERAKWLNAQALLLIWHQEDTVAGERILEEAVEMSTRIPQGHNLGVVRSWQGRAASANELLETMVQQTAAECFRVDEGQSWQMLGHGHFWAWRFDQAEACMLRALEIYGEYSPEIQHESSFLRSLMRIDSGQLEAARVLLARCEKVASTSKFAFRWQARWGYAMLALAEGDGATVAHILTELETLQLQNLSLPVYREAMWAGLHACQAALEHRWDLFMQELERARRLLGRLTWYACRARLMVDAAATVVRSGNAPSEVISYMRNCMMDAARDMAESPEARHYIEERLAELIPGTSRAVPVVSEAEARTLLFPADGSRPERVASYRVVGPLGDGGMSVVYRVENDKGQRFALKLPFPEVWNDPEFRQRFGRELTIARALQHDNLVALVEINDGSGPFGYPFLVMECVEGEPLNRLLTANHDTQNIVAVGTQTLAALGYLHDRGVVHRDIKPGNLMITPDGRVKLMDFGIARTTESAPLTGTSEALGTPQYMAPEQLAARPADGRSDIYALGTVLYQMVSGTVPFQQSNWLELAQLKLTQSPPDVRKWCPAVDERLSACIMTMIARRPEDRYWTAADALRDLQHIAPQATRFTWPQALLAAATVRMD